MMIMIVAFFVAEPSLDMYLPIFLDLPERKLTSMLYNNTFSPGLTGFFPGLIFHGCK